MFAALGAVNEAILYAGSSEQLYRNACEAAVSSGDFLTAAILMAEPEGQRLRVAAGAGEDIGRLRGLDMSGAAGACEEFRLCAKAFHDRRPVVSHACQDGRRSRDGNRPRYRRGGVAVDLRRALRRRAVRELASIRVAEGTDRIPAAADGGQYFVCARQFHPQRRNHEGRRKEQAAAANVLGSRRNQPRHLPLEVAGGTLYAGLRERGPWREIQFRHRCARRSRRGILPRRRLGRAEFRRDQEKQVCDGGHAARGARIDRPRFPDEAAVLQQRFHERRANQPLALPRGRERHRVFRGDALAQGRSGGGRDHLQFAGAGRLHPRACGAVAAAGRERRFRPGQFRPCRGKDEDGRTEGTADPDVRRAERHQRSHHAIQIEGAAVRTGVPGRCRRREADHDRDRSRQSGQRFSRHRRRGRAARRSLQRRQAVDQSRPPRGTRSQWHRVPVPEGVHQQ